MISLPTQYTGGYTAKFPVTYFVDVQVLSGSTVRHLYITNQPSMLFTYGGNVLSASGSTPQVQSSYLGAYITNTGQEQQVQGIGEIDFSLDNTQGGTQAALNTLSLIFLNQGSFVHSHQYDFENQPVKIFKTFASQSSSLNVDGVSGSMSMVPQFEGVVTQAYTYDPTRFQIDCVDRRQAERRPIPSYAINDTTCPNADNAAKGKFIPLVFGDFLTPSNVSMSGTLTLSGSSPVPLAPWVFGILPAAPTVITDETIGQSLVSDLPFSMSGNVFVSSDSNQWIAVIPQAPVVGSGSASVGWVSASGSIGTSFIPANTLTSLNVTPVYGEIYLRPQAQGYHLDILPNSRSSLTLGSWGPNVQMNIANMVDDNPDTSTEISADADGTGAYVGMVQVQIPSITPPGTFVNKTDFAGAYAANIDFYLGGIFEFAGGATTADFGLMVQDSTNPFSNHQGYGFSSGSSGVVWAEEWAIQASNVIPSATSMTWADLSRMYFAFYGASAGQYTKKLRIHHLWIRARTRFENTGIVKTAQQVPQYGWIVRGTPFQDILKGKPPFTTTWGVTGLNWEIRGSGISNLFIAAQGPRYTTQMLSASGSANGFSASSLIVNPAGVIEYLLRYRLGVTDSGLDLASFSTVGNASTGQRKDWKLAVSMLERKPVLDYIAQICAEYHLSLFVTSGGKYRLVAHDTVVSPVYNIVNSDLYFNGFPQIFMSTTTNDVIYNDITLNYSFDYTQSKNLRTMYVSDVNLSGSLSTNVVSNSGALRDTTYTGWMQDSITRYGVNMPMKIEATCIQESVTAELSLKKLCDWLAFKRLLVSMKCVRNMSIEALEPGDIVLITNSYLTSIFSNTAQFMIVGIRDPGVGSTADPYREIDCIELPSANTGTPILTSRFISSDDLVHGT